MCYVMKTLCVIKHSIFGMYETNKVLVYLV